MEKIELNGKTLSARELTVAEMDVVLHDLTIGEIHPIERVFIEEPITARVLQFSLDTDPNELLALPCRQMSAAIEQVKTQNPFFVRRMEKLAAILQDMAKKTETNEVTAVPLSDSVPTSVG